MTITDAAQQVCAHKNPPHDCRSHFKPTADITGKIETLRLRPILQNPLRAPRAHPTLGGRLKAGNRQVASFECDFFA
eukprot:7143189-Prymnesium_polylepis.1